MWLTELKNKECISESSITQQADETWSRICHLDNISFKETYFIENTFKSQTQVTYSVGFSMPCSCRAKVETESEPKFEDCKDCVSGQLLLLLLFKESISSHLNVNTFPLKWNSEVVYFVAICMQHFGEKLLNTFSSRKSRKAHATKQ